MDPSTRLDVPSVLAAHRVMTGTVAASGRPRKYRTDSAPAREPSAGSASRCGRPHRSVPKTKGSAPERYARSRNPCHSRCNGLCHWDCNPTASEDNIEPSPHIFTMGCSRRNSTTAAMARLNASESWICVTIRRIVSALSSGIIDATPSAFSSVPRARRAPYIVSSSCSDRGGRPRRIQLNRT